MLDPDRVIFDGTDRQRSRDVSREVFRDRPRERSPETSTNWWLVVVFIVFSIAGLVGFTAASQDAGLVSHEQAGGLGGVHGRGHGHLPLFD
jgi:hypothetical protein